jgi:hypothetical protein
MIIELCVVCLYVNLKLCVCFVELGLEGFLPLMPPSISSWSPTKKQPYAMTIEVKAHLVAVDAKLVVVEGDLKEFKVLGYHWNRNDSIICVT